MKTVNLSFQDKLLAQIDAAAERESRSRSELVREATRQYVTRQHRWDQVFALGDKIARKHGLSEADVSREIAGARRRRRSR